MSSPPVTTIPRYRPFALVALLVSTLYVCGWLESIERDLLDLRARLQKRPASGELVLVTIDPASLQALNSWPWPRCYHAQVLERLLAAGARRIAFDIDFSSSSTWRTTVRSPRPWHWPPATEWRSPCTSQWSGELFETAPLPSFIRHAERGVDQRAPGP